MTSAKQASARYTQEFKLEAVRWVKAGQAVVAAAKAPRISKASLSNRVRLAAKGKLDGGDVTGKPVKVTPEQMEIARLRAEAARLRMERAIAKRSCGVLRAGHAARYAWIHQMRRRRPVSVSCEAPEVGDGGYFNRLRRRESGQGGPARRLSDESLPARIRAIHAEVNGEYGRPRMRKELPAVESGGGGAQPRQ